MRRMRVIQTALLTVVLVGGVGFALMWGSASKSSAAPPASPPVPIVAGTVAQHDVPIYLTGVGTVVAYNTVVVRSQIQGQLVSIDFTEGQTVQAGDLLAQIDPRPYQAQIDQLTANRDRDQAQLTNALANLDRYTSLAQCALSASGRAAQCVVNPYMANASVEPSPRYYKRLRRAY